MGDARILTGDVPIDITARLPANVTTLPHLFQYRAETHPDSIAFSCNVGDHIEKITYITADRSARDLAAILASTLNTYGLHNRSGAPTIAIWLEKGLDLVLSILATTYAGATWLPFDPDVPVERAAICAIDASASIVIGDEAHKDRMDELRERTISELQAVGRPPLQCYTFSELSRMTLTTNISSTPRVRDPNPRDAAYLIYTSGTTGTPKGIAIPHSAALMFAMSEREILQTDQSDIVWNGFSPAFDMFVEEMWVTIFGGAHLAVGTRAECRDVPGLPTVWAARGVTIVNAVPTLIGIMDIARCDGDGYLLPSNVRLINLGGEACPPALVGRLARSGLRILNTYGPTETTVTATWDELYADQPVTIG